MTLSLLGLYLIGNKYRIGLLSFMEANICWIDSGYLLGNLASRSYFRRREFPHPRDVPVTSSEGRRL